MSTENRSAAVRTAEDHYRAGRWADAESLYRAVLDEQPNHVEAMLGFAVLCHQRGRSEQALALFRRVIALVRDSRVADRELGR